MSHLELLKRWYDRVWVQADPDAIDEMFSPDTAESGLLAQISATPEDFKAVVPALLELVDDPVFTIEQSFEAGDWLSAVLRLRSVSATSGAPVEATGQVMMRVDNGKIVEVYNHFDFLSFFEQLGLLPEATLMVCLSGEKIG